MKIAKLSLVAAVAVAGFTTANAQPLEEAIKNVDVSGSMVYRYNDYNGADKASGSADDYTTNNYKIGLNVSSKVNDDLKANTRFLVANPGFQDGNFAKLDASSDSDTNVNVTLSNANFAYTGVKNTTVTVGKQGLTTPWTVAQQIDGNEQTGTGVLALSTVGPVTFAGAYFNQTNLDKSTDAVLNSTKLYNSATSVSQLKGQNAVATVAAIAAIGPVTVDAWYLDLEKTFDTYTVGAKATTEVSGIKLGADARYASLTFDKDVATALVNAISADATKVEDKNSMGKIALTAKAGIVDGKVAYAKTGKEGGLTALDNDATTTLLGWNLTSNGKADADYWQLVAGVDVLANLNLSANYGDVKYKSAANSSTEMEDKEIYAQALYKMSKNLTTYVRYGQLTKENTTTSVKTTDGTVGRLQVAYTF